MVQFPFHNSVSIPWHKHLRRCSSRKGWALSDLWLIHSSSSCQANITLSVGSMWHSITMRGCDRTSPFPLHSLRAISDIASVLLCNVVYCSCLVLYCCVCLTGAQPSLKLTDFEYYIVSNVLKSVELLLSFCQTYCNCNLSLLLNHS